MAKIEASRRLVADEGEGIGFVRGMQPEPVFVEQGQVVAGTLRKGLENWSDIGIQHRDRMGLSGPVADQGRRAHRRPQGDFDLAVFDIGVDRRQVVRTGGHRLRRRAVAPSGLRLQGMAGRQRDPVADAIQAQPLVAIEFQQAGLEVDPVRGHEVEQMVDQRHSDRRCLGLASNGALDDVRDQVDVVVEPRQGLLEGCATRLQDLPLANLDPRELRLLLEMHQGVRDQRNKHPPGREIGQQGANETEPGAGLGRIVALGRRAQGRPRPSRARAISWGRGSGRPSSQPCAKRQPCRRSQSACSRVSTPSAISAIPRL